MARERLIRKHVHERFVITLDDGITFAGLLHEIDARVIVLVDAMQLAANGDQANVDGSLYLERARVAYMQRP